MFNILKPFQAQSHVYRHLYAWQGTAIVQRAIAPTKRGRVKFQGTYWFARCLDGQVFNPGMSVQVVGREELTLLVMAAVA